MTYTNETMELTAVCEWLKARGNGDFAHQMNAAFIYYTWTPGKNGLLRTDIIKECFELLDPNGILYKELQCDVPTYMQLERVSHT